MMRRLRYQLLREWWAWRPIVLSGLLLAFLLGLLLIFQINHSLDRFQDKVRREGILEFRTHHGAIEDSTGTRIKWYGGGNSDTVRIWFRWEQQKGLVTGTSPQQPGLLEQKFLHIGLFLVKAVLAGTLLLLLVLFILYFSEDLYRERLNNSTFFFRSLPVSDHFILLSKLLAGNLGFILLALVFSLLGIGYLGLYSFLGERQLGLPLTIWWHQLDFLNLWGNWLVFLIIAVVWSAPYFTFLLAVSAYVRSRPLWFGLGLPGLLVMALKFMFGSTSVLKPIFGFLADLVELWNRNIHSIWAATPGESVRLLGDFSSALFSTHSLGALLLAAAFYWVAWYAYRLNRSTA